MRPGRETDRAPAAQPDTSTLCAVGRQRPRVSVVLAPIALLFGAMFRLGALVRAFVVLGAIVKFLQSPRLAIDDDPVSRTQSGLPRRGAAKPAILPLDAQNRHALGIEFQVAEAAACQPAAFVNLECADLKILMKPQDRGVIAQLEIGEALQSATYHRGRPAIQAPGAGQQENAPAPMARRSTRKAVFCPESTKVRIVVATADTAPTDPARMSNEMIRRRAVSFATFSASDVVNPAPEKAESDWKRATSSDRPVILSAIVPIRTMRNESAMTIRSEARAVIGPERDFPANGCVKCARARAGESCWSERLGTTKRAHAAQRRMRVCSHVLHHLTGLAIMASPGRVAKLRHGGLSVKELFWFCIGRPPETAEPFATTTVERYQRRT